MNTQEISFQKKYHDFDYCAIEAVKQSRNNCCGIACLVSVLDYWEIKTEEQQILAEFPKSSEKGYSILELRNIAKAKGLEAYAISMQSKPVIQLKKQLQKGRPVICALKLPGGLYIAYDIPVYGQIYRKLLWMFAPKKNHYVLVFGLSKNEILIMDPAYGFASIPIELFHLSWSKRNYAALVIGVRSK